ncbi:MAG: hypothetical protein WA584_23495 [Pyrinomonadaceae bacterium]
MLKRHLTVGVDCGEHTAIAVYDILKKKIIQMETTDFFGAFRIFKTLPKENITVIVEVPAAFVYARNDFQKGSVRDLMCFHMGANRREAQLLAKGLRLWEYDVREVLPIRARKWTADQIRRELGITARTNQHIRDACRLALFHSSMRNLQ